MWKKIGNLNFSLFQKFLLYCSVSGRGMLIFTCLVLGMRICMIDISEVRLRNSLLDRKVYLLEKQLYASIPSVEPKAILNFRQHLALSVNLLAVARSLQELMQENGLLLSDVSYSPTAGAANVEVGRVEINAHLKSAYTPLKKAITGMLASHAGLALESVSMRRTRSTDALLDTELRFTFFYRKEP